MDFSQAKQVMLEEHLKARGITDARVIKAFEIVPREVFVPKDFQAQAYVDAPLPIGEGQTISQPYTVAFMTQLLNPQPEEIILEIGTGSGYQAAILSKLAKHVYSIERYRALARKAQKNLKKANIKNVSVIIRDGTRGLPQYAPYNGIITTAGAPAIPPPFLEQLAKGGRLVIPIGDAIYQQMTLIKKTNGQLVKQSFPGFRFVPLVGKYGWPEK